MHGRSIMPIKWIGIHQKMLKTHSHQRERSQT